MLRFYVMRCASLSYLWYQREPKAYDVCVTILDTKHAYVKCLFCYLKDKTLLSFLLPFLLSFIPSFLVFFASFSLSTEQNSWILEYRSKLTIHTISYNVSLFIIKCSTCFGLFSPLSGATFWSCISQLV